MADKISAYAGQVVHYKFQDRNPLPANGSDPLFPTPNEDQEKGRPTMSGRSSWGDSAFHCGVRLPV